jgi:transposase-like protein
MINNYFGMILNLNKLDKVSSSQYWVFKGKFNILDKKKEVTLLLEQDDTVKCGHCHSTHFVKNGRLRDLQRYKCKTCGRNFNQLTGTPLARLKKKGRWLRFSECLNQGLSVRKAAEEVGVNKNTSFKWRHRFLKNTNDLYAKALNGAVETAETSFKYSEKGGAIPYDRPRRFGEQIYVFTSLDRDRLVTTPIIDKFELQNIYLNFNTKIAKDSFYITKNNSVIKEFSIQKGLNHYSLEKIELPSNTSFHINNVLGYNKSLKVWMKRFRGVSTKYLSNYLSWFRELEEFFQDAPPKIILVRAKSLERFPYNPRSYKEE